jgi:hypothetical protein
MLSVKARAYQSEVPFLASPPNWKGLPLTDKHELIFFKYRKLQQSNWAHIALKYEAILGTQTFVQIKPTLLNVTMQDVVVPIVAAQQD